MIKFRVKGLEKVKKLLEQLKEAGQNPRTAYDLVGQRMLAMQKRHFKKQEGPGGEKWAQLKPKTIARRRGGRAATTPRGRLGVAGAGRGVQILRDTGTMYRSLIYSVTNEGVEAGVPATVPYGRTHQYGDLKRKIPARPFCYINEKEAQQLLNTFKKEVLRVLEESA